MESGEAELETGEPGLDPSVENLGLVQEEISLFNEYAVGVMPLDMRACPAENQVTIYTDDEDDDNESDSTGFELPQTVQDGRNYNHTLPYGGSDFLAFDAIIHDSNNTTYDIAQVQ